MDAWSRWALIVRSHYMLQHGMRATEDFVSHELGVCAGSVHGPVGSLASRNKC